MSKMRRNKTLGRGRLRDIRLFPVLVAGGIGYLLGGLHLEAIRTTAATDLSAAQTVALRFPEIQADTAPAADSPIDAAAPADVADDNALFNPEPMVPRAGSSQPALQSAARNDPSPAQPHAVQVAALDTHVALPDTRALYPHPAEVKERAEAAHAAPRAAVPQRKESKPVALVHPRVVSRPGYLLNDAQIANIKQRLNLTPDQERMWPAVEAALRNMAYTRAQQARSTTAGATQTAEVDPEAVEGLKSAAVPLIMSFNDEQKEEVRNLVHVMGLDQLASQF